MPAPKKSVKSGSKPKAAAKVKTVAKAPVVEADSSRLAVNTHQAAASAAAMVANKVENTSQCGPATESAMFRNMKQSLAKPHSQVIGGLLDKLGPGGQKKSNLPFTGDKQVGHNQTVGSDASRRNVPRRTGG